MLIDHRHENLTNSLHMIIEDLQLTVSNLTERIGYMDDKFETFEQTQLEIVARVNGNEQKIQLRINEVAAELASIVTEVASKVTTIETNITSLITTDAQINQTVFHLNFGDANIGLWNMGGKFPNKKVS